MNNYQLVDVIELDNAFKNIADAIREKNGTDNTYKPSEMPQGVESVYDKGYEQGKAEGGEPDPELVKQAQLIYISRSMSFTDNTTLTCFELDCANKTNFANSFTRCTNLTDIKITNTGNVTNWTYTFYMCSSLVNLEELDFSSGTNLQACFNGCSKLVNLKVVPESIKKNVDFYYSPLLSDDSIQFIVDGYADMTGQTAPILKVHPTVKAKIEADGAKDDTDPTKRYWLRDLTAKNVTLA